jgi:hypothetical protein
MIGVRPLNCLTSLRALGRLPTRKRVSSGGSCEGSGFGQRLTLPKHGDVGIRLYEQVPHIGTVRDVARDGLHAGGGCSAVETGQQLHALAPSEYMSKPPLERQPW